MAAAPIVKASHVRYIKLGQKSKWAKECLENETVRIGYWTDRYFELCRAGQWDKLDQAYIAQGQARRIVTQSVGEVRTFYEDDGTILWITFEHHRLYWTFIDPSVAPRKVGDGEEGSYRKVIGWRSVDITGKEIPMTELSGNLTKTASYRGTSCDIEDPAYVVSRINGERRPEVIDAARLAAELESAIVRLMRLLTWKDFELLVELVFSQSGWRRTSATGKTQKTIDLDMLLPSTGERAFVQVKSETTQAEFDDYRQRFTESGYDKMFFVFHSGRDLANQDEAIHVLGPNAIARMVLDAGLLYWLMSKVA